MDRKIDWAGLETVADLLGIDDLEILIVQLLAIRDFERRNA